MTTKSSYTPQQILNYQKNDEMIRKTKETQGETLESLDRTKKHLHQAEKHADIALENLAEQREKMVTILKHTDQVQANLERSDVLVDQVGIGFKIPNIFTLTESQKKTFLETLSVYEQQQYSFVTNKWSESNYFPAQNPKENLKDVFDPYLKSYDGTGNCWILDLSFSDIDGDGWTYGKSFHEIDRGNGTNSMQNYRFHCVRRRVWKRNNEAKSSKVNEILFRKIHQQHQDQLSASLKDTHPHSEVHPQDVKIIFEGTQHVHNDMTTEQEQQLKQIKATDTKIDKSVQEIDEGVDRLHAKAREANTELKVQKEIIKVIDNNVDRDLNHITDVNHKLKHKVDNQCNCLLA